MDEQESISCSKDDVPSSEPVQNESNDDDIDDQDGPPLQYVGDGSDNSSHDSEESEGTDSTGSENADDIFRRIAAEDRAANRNVDEENLPPTVTVLNGDSGEKIYLIGTAHFSTESCEDVRKVIRESQPDVVVIELCRGRTDILHNDEKKLIELAGDVNSSKILRQVRDKGVLSGLMTFFLLHMSAHITKQLGMAPGSEFRTAYHEARRIPGCKVMFGDRPVSITLRRAFAELPLWQRLKFMCHAVKDLGPIKPEDIEKLKKKDLLEQALGEMMEQFPQLAEVFLAERDVYLAKSLQLASSMVVDTSEGVRPPVVVAVVGLGHAAGVAKHFERKIEGDEVDKLLEIPERSRSSKIVAGCTKILLLAICFYGVYQVGLRVLPFARWASSTLWSGIKYLTNLGNPDVGSIGDEL